MTETPAALSPIAEAFKPSTLGARGAAFWSYMGGDRIADPARAVVLAETCRLADQLDRLDGLTNGDVAWYQLERDDDDPTITVVINGAVSERRQTATVFRHLVAQLTNVAPVAKPEPATASEAGREPTVDELEQQRALRRAAAQGS
ncbi:MAG: hypothetical protein WBA00_11365 [Rhodococcus sp. (in: high G+C Gram-positive bacteria)]